MKKMLYTQLNDLVCVYPVVLPLVVVHLEVLEQPVDSLLDQLSKC